MSGLRRQYDRRRILLEPLDQGANLLTLQAVAGVENVKLNDEGCELRLAADTDPATAIRAITTVVAPARIELARIRLEDVFIRLVSEAGAADASHEALRTHLQGLSQTGAVS
jgi:hypothetical protein